MKQYFTDTYKRTLIIFSTLFFLLPIAHNGMLTLLMLLWLINSFVVLKKADWAYAIKHPITILSLTFYALYAASMLYSTDTANGLRGLETRGSLLVAPLIILAHRRLLGKNGALQVVKAFIWGNFAVCTLALIYAAYRVLSTGQLYFLFEGSEFKHYYFLYDALSEPFMHPGYLSTYVGLAIIGCIYFLSKTKAKGWLAGLMFLLITLFLLQGRINILALFVVLGVGALVAAIVQRAYKMLLLPVFAVVAFLVVIFIGGDAIKSRFIEMPDFSYDISGTEFTSATYRLAEWSCALDAIAQKPLTGHGIGDSRAALRDMYGQRGFHEGVRRNFNAHNQYLETVLAIGFVGLLVLLLIISVYVKMGWKQKHYLLLASLLFMVLSMLTESMLERAWGVVLFNAYFPLLLLVRGDEDDIEAKFKEQKSATAEPSPSLINHR